MARREAPGTAEDRLGACPTGAGSGRVSRRWARSEGTGNGRRDVPPADRDVI